MVVVVRSAPPPFRAGVPARGVKAGRTTSSVRARGACTTVAHVLYYVYAGDPQRPAPQTPTAKRTVSCAVIRASKTANALRIRRVDGFSVIHPLQRRARALSGNHHVRGWGRPDERSCTGLRARPGAHGVGSNARIYIRTYVRTQAKRACICTHSHSHCTALRYTTDPGLGAHPVALERRPTTSNARETQQKRSVPSKAIAGV